MTSNALSYGGGEFLVAMANALVAFVVDKSTRMEMPTMTAESSFIVATNAPRFSQQLTYYPPRVTRVRVSLTSLKSL